MRSFAEGAWSTRGSGTVGGRSSASPVFGGSLNFDQGQDGEAPAIDFAHLPQDVHSDLGRQGARARGNKLGHSLEDRNRQEIYEVAKRRDIRGRSKMGKWELIEAIRKSE